MGYAGLKFLVLLVVVAVVEVLLVLPLLLLLLLEYVCTDNRSYVCLYIYIYYTSEAVRVSDLHHLLKNDRVTAHLLLVRRSIFAARRCAASRATDVPVYSTAFYSL